MGRTRILISAVGLAAMTAGCVAKAPPKVAQEPAAKEKEPEAEPLACGAASYYADDLAGHKTASGEPYDPEKATAAHPSLPFGAKLKVTRGDAETVVTVNDRGPYAEGRIIDLSRVAAEEIGLVKDGVAEVCVTVIEQAG